LINQHHINIIIMATRFTRYEPVPQAAYQVDFVSVNCGKIIASSKRKIRFKFGYSNQEALNEGKTGQDCRGSEHEITIIWSLSSGKQAIAYDQKEVYFDVGDTTQSKISHTFKDQRGHTIQVKAHAANMSTKSVPDPHWQQYDILINGVSFFRMPKIFEIGVVPKVDTNDDASFKLAPKFAEYSSPNEGILSSEEQPNEPPEVADLLSFDDFESAALPPAPVQAVSTTQQTYNVPPTTQAPPIQQQTYNMPPTQAPPIQQMTYAAPAPTHEQIQQQSYAPAITNQQEMNNAPVPTNQFQQPYGEGPPTPQGVQPSTNFVAPTPMATTYAQAPQPVTPPQEDPNSTALVPSQTAPTAGYGVGGVDKLVNLDNLFGTTSPVTQQSVDAKMQEANAHKSLSQLQGSNTTATTEWNVPVMNPFNTFAPANQQQQQQQQPPMYGYPAQQPPQQPFQQQGFGY